MIKRNRKTTNNDAYKFLDFSKEGILSTLPVENGYPYSTALNHVYLTGYVCFHCEKNRHKVDNILSNNKISLSQKSTGSFSSKAAAEIASTVNKTMVIRVEIDHISDKTTRN